MVRALVIANNQSLARDLTDRLSKSPLVEACHQARHLPGGIHYGFEEYAIDTAVYVPELRDGTAMVPNLDEAAIVLDDCARAGLNKVVLISSAAIYGATPYSPGLVTEDQFPLRMGQALIPDAWIQLEALAQEKLVGIDHLTVLRPTACLTDGEPNPLSQLFQQSVAFTPALYNSTLQLLSPDDLVQAVGLAIEHRASGVFNVAPSGVMFLNEALHLAGVRRIPMLSSLQRLPRQLLAARGIGQSGDQLDYMRFNSTVATTKITAVLGFRPGRSSAEALMEFMHLQEPIHDHGPQPSFDDFGLDPAYIEAKRKSLFKFLHDRYWRIETLGLEHVPQDGRAVMVGAHRGFMPYDGVMALHIIAEQTGRYVRFLIHPSLTKWPIPFNFTKLGGVLACRENADHILQRDELLGFFPEGIQGAFGYYRDAYRLRRFGRDEFVKAALRNRAPLVPFVTVGSAEIFPIFAKIRWPWWKRMSLWPCFPIAPPFPVFPMPVPSKWHTWFLEPIRVEKDYPPEAADDLATVQAISAGVRTRMQEAIDQMLERRRSIFVGDIFDDNDRR